MQQPPRGDLQLSPDMRHPNILLDGLGRVTGLLDAMDDDNDPEIRNWAQDVEVLVMLITGTPGHTLSYEQLGQLFFDFNALSEPVPQGQAIDLDQSDPYIQVAARICKLPIVTSNGGMDPRAIKIGKSREVWVTKPIMLRAARAAAQGPGSHVDHIREAINDQREWMKGSKQQQELLERFDEALTTMVEALGGTVPAGNTMLCTATWWIAFGLVLHDLYRTYGEATKIGLSEAYRKDRLGHG
jgi:hypothetical protein